MTPIVHLQVDLNARANRDKLLAHEATSVTGPTHEVPELVPIDELARRFGLRASAVRYYEERGLLFPVSRHSGRRWYGPDEVRRLAIIRFWQQSGLMTLEEVADMMAGPASGRRWRQVLEERVEALRGQIEQMEAAKRFLEHVIDHHDYAPDGCPYYETLIFDGDAGHSHGAHDHGAHDHGAHDHGAHDH
jgi:DNA-binding transcriptional MerR regulator